MWDQRTGCVGYGQSGTSSASATGISEGTLPDGTVVEYDPSTGQYYSPETGQYYDASALASAEPKTAAEKAATSTSPTALLLLALAAYALS